MADTRVTQAPIVTAVEYVSEAVRATQAPVISVIRYTSESIRVTQTAVITVVNVGPECLTYDAFLWAITRTDGVTYRFTSHDRAIAFEGESYSPCASLTPSAVQLTGELGGGDSVDLEGIISDGAISEVDIWAGLFNGATVAIRRVNWNDLDDHELILSGTCGAFEFDEIGFKFEVVSLGERLTQQPILRRWLPTCRFKLGDAQCGFDLSTLEGSGTVEAVSSRHDSTQAHRRIFTDTNRAEADNYWQLGTLTWTSGQNNGQSVDIRSSTSAGIFELEKATQYPIEVGDTFTVLPGCDRSFATCQTKFSNEVNFGGFPFIKGDDDLIETAPAQT